VEGMNSLCCLHEFYFAIDLKFTLLLF
jgi:hypothetical protein